MVNFEENSKENELSTSKLEESDSVTPIKDLDQIFGDFNTEVKRYRELKK